MKEETFHKDKNVGITLVKDEKTLKVYSSETVGPPSVLFVTSLSNPVAGLK